MKARAVTIIRDTLTPEYRKWHDIFVKDYLPHCRKTDGASALPGGAAWYAARVKAHTTTDLGEALLAEGLIQPAQLEAARKVQQNTGEPTEQILLSQQALSETQLYQFVARQQGLDFVALARLDWQGLN